MRHSLTISWRWVAAALFLFIPFGFAASATWTQTDTSVRAIVSGIVSYTRWPGLQSQPTLCIFSTSRFTQVLSGSDNVPLSYIPIIVHNDQEALGAGCNALYFGNESPESQQGLINAFHSRPLLLISEQNSQCQIGSAFCLIFDSARVRFAVNLDALSRSGVRVNPDVLMLARNPKHE